MKDWLVARSSNYDYWLTRIETLPNGRQNYLCGFCDGPLENHVVAFFESSKGSHGTVACSVCQHCDLLLGGDETPASELDTQIELLLAITMAT